MTPKNPTDDPATEFGNEISPEGRNSKSPMLPVLIILAFASVYIIWGTTYLAMKYAVQTIPPFTMAGIRFFIAGSGLYLVLRLFGQPNPTKNQWFHSAVVGACLMAGGNGLVSLAEKEIPSGIAALVVATMPLWMAFFNFVGFEKKRLPWTVILGLIIGFAGTSMLLLNQPPAESSSGGSLWAMVAIILAPASWSIGSLYSRNANLPSNPFMATAAQMLTGSTVLCVLSLATGEIFQWDPYKTSPKSILAVTYLVFFGAIVALTSYVWLLKHVAPSKVATYTYVNPIIAVFLGWFIANESVNGWTFFSVFMILGAVFLIASNKDKGNKK